MRIPKNLKERSVWLDRTLMQLRGSLGFRRSRYGSWRQWYLHGSNEWGARYNKILPGINTLASYLYSPRSVRFAFTGGPLDRPQAMDMNEVAASRLRALWNASGADAVWAGQMPWTLTFGATVAKLQWHDGQPRADAIAPENFGVWRDDLPTLDGQQAILHTYRLDPDSVREWLISNGMPSFDVEAALRRWGEGAQGDEPSNGSISVGALNPIAWNNPPPQGSAGVVSDWGSVAADYGQGNDASTLAIEEVWARDDAADDWRIFQIIEKDLVVSDRPNNFLPHHCPFVQITCDPLDSYFWGYSTVAQLIPLQAWREKRMNQLDRMFARQANPPMVFSGFMGGVSDEKAAAVMRRGGLLANSQTPSAKVDLLTPQVNELSFTEISEIDMMFNETLGLTEVLQGGMGGGRGGEQHKQIVAAGAGKLTRRMMNVERSVAEGAALMLALARRYDANVLKTDDGQDFLIGELPEDSNVEVAAHSASPVFAEQAEQRAVQMMELGLIGKEDWFDIADPPFAQALKERLKAREKKQADQTKQMIESTPISERASLFARIIGAGRGRK